MRKTTIAAFVILLGGFGALLWMLHFYTRQVREESAASGDWTKELRAAGSLAPDTMVKLRRGPSGPDDPVPDKGTYGLVVEVTLSEAAIAKDPKGAETSAWLARSAFERYGDDRPIDWVRVHVFRGGDAPVGAIAFTRVPRGEPLPVASKKEGAPAPPPP